MKQKKNKKTIMEKIEKDIMGQIKRDAPPHWGNLTGYTTLDSLMEYLSKIWTPSEEFAFKCYWSLANLEPSFKNEHS